MNEGLLMINRLMEENFFRLLDELLLLAALSDSVAKESCMLNLLLSLPEPNLVTFLFLLDHLKRWEELAHLCEYTHTHTHTADVLSDCEEG